MSLIAKIEKLRETGWSTSLVHSTTCGRNKAAVVMVKYVGLTQYLIGLNNDGNAVWTYIIEPTALTKGGLYDQFGCALRTVNIRQSIVRRARR